MVSCNMQANRLPADQPKRSPALRETKDCRTVSDAPHCAGMNRLLFADNLKWLWDRNIVFG
jgi:hypothetical protein